MKKFLYIVVMALIFWQLFGWWEFTPKGIVDPYYDLARMYYYLLFFPVGVIGLFTAVHFLFFGKLSLNLGTKLLIIFLLIISLSTSIPPLFKIVRYVFYPFANLNF